METNTAIQAVSQFSHSTCGKASNCDTVTKCDGETDRLASFRDKAVPMYETAHTPVSEPVCQNVLSGLNDENTSRHILDMLRNGIAF